MVVIVEINREKLSTWSIRESLLQLLGIKKPLCFVVAIASGNPTSRIKHQAPFYLEPAQWTAEGPTCNHCRRNTIIASPPRAPRVRPLRWRGKLRSLNETDSNRHPPPPHCRCGLCNPPRAPPPAAPSLFTRLRFFLPIFYRSRVGPARSFLAGYTSRLESA